MLTINTTFIGSIGSSFLLFSPHQVVQQAEFPALFTADL